MCAFIKLSNVNASAVSVTKGVKMPKSEAIVIAEKINLAPETHLGVDATFTSEMSVNVKVEEITLAKGYSADQVERAADLVARYSSKTMSLRGKDLTAAQIVSNAKTGNVVQIFPVALIGKTIPVTVGCNIYIDPQGLVSYRPLVKSRLVVSFQQSAKAEVIAEGDGMGQPAQASRFLTNSQLAEVPADEVLTVYFRTENQEAGIFIDDSATALVALVGSNKEVPSKEEAAAAAAVIPPVVAPVAPKATTV